MTENQILAKFSPDFPWWMTWLPVITLTGVIVAVAARAPLKARVCYGISAGIVTGLMPHIASWLVPTGSDIGMRIRLTLIIATPLIAAYVCHRHARRFRTSDGQHHPPT
jgi:hypothetical protein